MTTVTKLLLVQLLITAAAAAAAAAAAVKKHEGSPFGEVCYEDLGCFKNEGKFFDWLKRPLFNLPQSPQEINTAFTVFTRRNPLNGAEVKFNDAASVRAAGFAAWKQTKILIHGFLSNPATNWMAAMKDALLQRGDYNVIVVDWSSGNGFPYGQAAANTRVVGAVVARLLQWLQAEFGLRVNRCHIIGHSLGAHTAGYVGERLPDLSRITGLDPAGPYFDNTDPIVRLDPSDAQFVDVVHTDGEVFAYGGFGTMQPLGHVDFYPNGGKNQPGCTRNPIISIVEPGQKFTITCNHKRAAPLFAATVLNPAAEFKAVECRSHADFKAGKCTCDSGECATLGFSANGWKPKGRQNVKMFLDTADQSPFQIHHYHIGIEFPRLNGAKQQFGDLEVELVDSNGRSSGSMQMLNNKFMSPGSSATAMLTSSVSVSRINTVRVQWRNRYMFPIDQKSLFFGKVDIIEWRTGRKTRICGHNAGVKSDEALWLRLC